MQFYKMAAFTYGMETQDYYGDTMSGVRGLLQDQENTVRASFKDPQKPQRPKLDKKASKEEKAAAEKEYARQLKTYSEKVAAVNKQREQARQKVRLEQRGYQEAMTDVRNTMRYTSVSTKDRKPSLPHDYQYPDAKPKSSVSPGTMLGHEAVTKPGQTPLEAYAEWMTNPENPRFTTVIANRLWKRAFGLALIEPLDELMDTTVPMIPELQKHLEKLVVSANYDMKAVLRILYNTKAYQAQVTRAEHSPGTVYHFTGPLLRRMSAEQMWDSFVTLINPSPDMINQTNRDVMEQRILDAVEDHDIELVVLARYMQILSPELCRALEGRAINIHHSFLPGFKGASPYKQAHARGVKLIGATAHFVTTDLDEGPIIEQNVVRVDHSRTPAELMSIGQDEESRTLTQAVKWFAEKRILVDGARTIIFT
jgi:folate-dependent phosphoribosylglycinamide formyltransferase PurN